MNSTDDILKKILLNMRYDASKTLKENKEIILENPNAKESISNNVKNEGGIKCDSIDDYLKKKSIKLDEANMLKIENIIDNPEISLRKYITISKLYQDISKISFIKKVDETNYAVILDDKVKKSKTSSFFK